MADTRITLFWPAGTIKQYETNGFSFNDKGALVFEEVQTKKTIWTTLPFLIETSQR